MQGVEGVQVVVGKTGVEHLEKAAKPFHIGVQWEPNGHKKVLVRSKAVHTLTTALDLVKADKAQAERIESLQLILAVSRLAN